MTRRRIPILLAFLFLLPTRLRAEVIHGVQLIRATEVAEYGALWDEALDLSTQSVVSAHSELWDLAFGIDIRWNNGLNCRACNGAEVDGSLESITVAPEHLSSFGSRRIDTFTLDQCYVIKTSDGLYAKFRVMGFDMDGYCCSITVDYYVQMDGSPSFAPALPVEPATWGRVKALYR
jgi:hypothetical protein